MACVVVCDALMRNSSDLEEDFGEFTNSVYKVPRPIQYLGLDKCWTIPGNSGVFFKLGLGSLWTKDVHVFSLMLYPIARKDSSWDVNSFTFKGLFVLHRRLQNLKPPAADLRLIQVLFETNVTIESMEGA
jgi:hypothetical protein